MTHWIPSLGLFSSLLICLTGPSYAQAIDQSDKEKMTRQVDQSRGINPSSATIYNRIGLPFGNLMIKKVTVDYFYKDRGYHRNTVSIIDRSVIDPGSYKTISLTSNRCVYNVVARIEGVDASGNKILIVGSYPIKVAQSTPSEPGPLGAGCITGVNFYTDSLIVR